jgi:dTDP-glucose pyrophosphorylase
MNEAHENWREAILSNTANIKDAIQVLNDIKLKIILVVDENGKFEGTILDGDIRRGLLRGLDLSSSVEFITHRDALVVPPEMHRDLVLQLMTANKIHQIPIVNSNQQVIGLHLWDEIKKSTIRTNLMVIMAGGKGTRLYPQTANCPKPLLRVSGKPILEHIIERAKIEGFSNFVLAIHYLGHMIEEYFGNGSRFGVKIEYLREEIPLGTAGGLSLLNPIPEEEFIVTNGDVITDIRYGEMLDFHKHQSAAATMAVRLHEWQNPFGVVQTDGIEITGYEEKPIMRSYINAGVYIIGPRVLAYLENTVPCDMPSLLTLLQKDLKRVIAYPIHEPWLDVGNPVDLEKAQAINQFKGGQSL